MTWTKNMLRGAGLTFLGTATMIALSVLYLWHRPEAAAVSTWDFTKLAVVVVFVWAAIGITMGIFIVMILKKNEGKG